MQENLAKIISATYRLLDYCPEGDPLKNKAKEKVLAILENATPEDIGLLQDYLELGKTMGWIDGVNFLIVSKEWASFRVSLQPARAPKLKADEIFKPQLRPKHIAPEAGSPRQRKILAMLAQRERVQVQDIIKEMPDVTKRTIRRDLDDLLKKGEVTRTGAFNQVFYQIS